MLKNKKAISGRKIAPGIIEVDFPRKSKLIQGQKVLIYQPTSKAIVSASGRIIGQKEKIMGIGKVSFIGDKVVVKESRSRMHKSLSVKSNIPKSLNKSYKITGQKSHSPKAEVYASVFIKPIEE